MNKLFARIASITAGLALVVGAGVALASHAEAKGVKAGTSLVATFECGADGAASHNDGSSATTYEETDGDYTLSISSGVKFYTGARDAKGNGGLKFGTSSAVGSMSIAVPSNVDLVKIYVGGYKATAAKVSVNGGATTTISTLSNNGEYTAVEASTSTNKTLTFTTVSGGVRCLINTIEFYAEEGGGDKEDTSVSITTTKPLALDVNDSPVQLAVTTSPASIASSLVYSSSNDSVASVSTSGLVSPQGTGSAIITVAYAGDDQYKSSSDTISVNVTEAEPAHVTGKTISEIVSEISTAGTTTAVRIYEIEGYVTAWKTGTDGGAYGNFYIADTDGDTTNQAYVYGANYGNSPSWNGVNYEFHNNQTFLTNEVTSQIVIGSRITANFLAFMYGSTFEFQGEIKTVSNVAKVLDHITVDTTGAKTSFEVNEAFSSEGIVVTAHYDDSTYKEVTPESVSSPDMTSIGEKTVTVSYTEGGVTKTVEYQIQVTAPKAKWTVEFNANGGSGTMDSVQVTEGEDYELPACTFTAPEGKVFDHWADENGDAITIIEDIDDDYVAYATWKDAPSEVDATMTAGTNGSTAKVVVGELEKDAIKVGTSSKGGDMTITVGAGAQYVKFYAAAWKGVTGLSLNITGATVNPASVALTADDGMTSNSPFTLAGNEEDFLFTVYLSDISSETTITLTTSTTKRFVLWGAVYGTSGDVPQTPTVESIELSNIQTEYEVGDEFVMPTVTAHYDDESSKVVTNNLNQTGFDSSAAATGQQVTVSYTEGDVTVYATAYSVNISEPTPAVTATYKKVETNLADFTGDYLIVYEEGSLAFDGSRETLDASSNTQAVTINDGVIQASEAYEFHIAAKEDGYSIQSSSGLYIGKTADSNGLDSKAADDYVNTISYVVGETSEMGVVGSGGAHLRYNASSGQERFRFFKSSSYTGQKAIALYQKVDEAEALALDILNLTEATCSAQGEKSAYESAWTTLATKYAAVTDKSKLVDTVADANGVMLKEALARYDYLVARFGLDAFIEGRVISARYIPTMETTVDSNVAIMVVTIVAITSISAIGVILVIKRRKAIR